MRIFERLRGRSRSGDSAIKGKLLEAVIDGLLREREDGTPLPSESKPNCCSCCSAEYPSIKEATAQ